MNFPDVSSTAGYACPDIASVAMPIEQSGSEDVMPADPWSRPTLEELRQAEQAQPTIAAPPTRARLWPCCIPAEVITRRGNIVSAMTRRIGAGELSLVHKGFVPLGPAWIRLADDRESQSREARVESCVPCARRLFRSVLVIIEPDRSPRANP